MITRRIISALSAVIILLGCTAMTPEKDQEVRHIVMWTLNDKIEGTEKEALIQSACKDFYTLEDKIPGIIDMKAIYEGRLESSNCDFMFDIRFENEEALENFSVHPEHLKMADKLKPYIASRACLDVRH